VDIIGFLFGGQPFICGITSKVDVNKTRRAKRLYIWKLRTAADITSYSDFLMHENHGLKWFLVSVFVLESFRHIYDLQLHKRLKSILDTGSIFKGNVLYTPLTRHIHSLKGFFHEHFARFIPGQVRDGNQKNSTNDREISCQECFSTDF
jgi:hypothetical protein